MKIPTLNNLLATHFGELPYDTRDILRKQCVQLVFRRMTNGKFTASVRKLIGFCPQKFKDDVVWNGNLVKNLKLFTVHCKRNKLSVADAVDLRRRFGLQMSDARLYEYSSAYAVPRHVPTYSLQAFDKLMMAICEDVLVFTNKFVYRKMRFIINSSNHEAEDLVGELILDALQSVCYMFPRIATYEHAVNIAKQSIHQRGVNLLKAYSTEKRNRLQEVGGKMFVNQVIPVLNEMQLKLMLRQEYNHDNLSCGMAGNDRDVDLALDVKHILERATGKKKVFLGLLLGEYSPEFTKYLHDGNVIQASKTNQDLFDRRADTAYVQHAIQYAKLSEERGEKILRNLRKTLVHYR